MKATQSTFLGAAFACVLATGMVAFQAPTPRVEGRDPREIPVPPIKTPIGTLPGVNELPVRTEMPDILTSSDGTKVTTPAQWTKRRAELRRILEYYAVGQAPPAPGNVRGREIKVETVLGGRVKYRLVTLDFGPKRAVALNIGIFTPAKGGPFPAVILPAGTPPGATPLPRQPLGPNQGRGENVLMIVGRGPASASPPPSIPGQAGAVVTAEELAGRHAELFRRGYALVVFNNNDCAEDTTLRNEDGSWAFRNTRFYPAYPNYDWGVLAGWAWGVSRIADYLETDRAIDKTKLIVTGASRSGKAAMIAAAFDERLMGAPVVTGGGGIGAYRFSGAGRGGREGLGEMMNKYPNWFSPHLHEFWGQTDRLPFDAHWFLALCAPRPFIALEGDTDNVSLPNAVKQSILAAQPAYELLKAKDHLGVNYAHHAHAFTEEDWSALLDFADKHLRGMPVAREFDRFLPETVALNVRDFGAVGDGVTKDTAAFQKALDMCAIGGGGDVLAPPGRYLIGSVQIGSRSVIRLEKDSVIVGSPDVEDYPMVDVRWEGRWQPGRRALIYAANVDHIGIVGPGRIEGNPAVAAPQNPRGSVVLEPVNCNDVRWEGFTVTQGGNWATHLTYCNDVVIRNVTIVGGRDGIDVDSCKNVRIERCDIDTGDDSISLKSGRGRDGARIGRPVEDVLIADSKLTGRRFACIGIGSEISAGVRNVRIERCRMSARTHAIYIKTRIGRAGVTENISGDDLDVTGGGFLRVNLTVGGNTNTADDPVEGLIGYPSARGLRFSNVRLKDASVLAEVTQIAPEKPVLGLSLIDISGTVAKGISLQHVRDAVLRNINVTGFTGPLLSTNDVTGAGLEGAVALAAPSAP
jgi:Glycosyl hydrolases family 28